MHEVDASTLKTRDTMETDMADRCFRQACVRYQFPPPAWGRDCHPALWLTKLIHHYRVCSIVVGPEEPNVPYTRAPWEKGSKILQDRQCQDPLTAPISDEDKRNPSVFQGFQALSCSGQDFGATHKDAVDVERLLRGTDGGSSSFRVLASDRM